MKKQNLLYLTMCLILLVAVAASAQEMRRSPASGPVRVNFDNDAVGQPPVGFTSYASGGGPAGKWLVREKPDAPSPRNVVEQTDADSTDSRFPILIADQGEYAEVDVSVKGKAIAGKVDRAIGLVFRFHDPQSYYVCRANALEDNFNLYKMVQGRRQQLAGAKVKVSASQWHALRVVAKGDRIVCYFDGQKLIEVQDATYPQGKVGLWTKADSITVFDDLTVVKP